MSSKEFLIPEAKVKVSQAIAAVEAQTAAEVVVAVRKESGHYRHTDYLLGALFALVGLLVFLFHPEPFDEDLFALVEVFFFLAGVAVSIAIEPVRRLLTAPSLRERNVLTAARAAFVELGVSRTKARNGILVYVALFERQVEVVTDVGIVVDQLEPAYQDAVREIKASVREGGMARFVAGVERMGPALGKAMPRSEDDVNELSDEVQ